MWLKSFLNSNYDSYMLDIFTIFLKIEVNYIQKSGYLRFFGMLLIQSATTNIINAPSPTGMIAYKYPKLWILLLPITAIKAVAPPGGCNVLVKCIIAIAVATAREEVSHIGVNRSLIPSHFQVLFPSHDQVHFSSH